MDGVINKRVSLGDIKAMWQILMSQTPKALNHYNVSITTRQRPARLSNEEASVLRGYSCNLKTKQIARQLGCNVRLVYFYKNNAMNKLKAVRGPSFYQSIRWILN
ncbi:LuxR C-terminal-related transcriptional regulator [Enterobacter cloacae]